MILLQKKNQQQQNHCTAITFFVYDFNHIKMLEIVYFNFNFALLPSVCLNDSYNISVKISCLDMIVIICRSKYLV
jgi:hypothetical protein